MVRSPFRLAAALGGVPTNASNVTLSVFCVRSDFIMASDSFALQLHCRIGQLAQLNEPSLATMGVVTHLGGGTAHEDQDDPSAFTQARPLFCRLLTRVSHSRSVEASTLPASERTAFVPLEYPAVGSGAAA